MKNRWCMVRWTFMPVISWLPVKVSAAAVKTTEIIFHEDRSSVLSRYIGTVARVVWKDALSLCVAAVCTAVAIWLAKPQKKQGDN